MEDHSAPEWLLLRGDPNIRRAEPLRRWPLWVGGGR